MTYAEIVMLAMLMKEKRHGYDMKRNAERIFGDNMTINNNTLYTNLHRFQKMGAVKSEVQSVPGKPDRHVYSITDRGREIFRELILDFTPETAASDFEFYARVAFFHLLEPEERRKILAARRAVLEARSKRIEEFHASRMRRPEAERDYDQKVVRFMADQTASEIRWLETLESAGR